MQNNFLRCALFHFALSTASSYSQASDGKRIELSAGEQDQLLAAMPVLFSEPPSSALAAAMELPTPEKIRVLRSPQFEDQPVRISATIYYPAEDISPTRRRIPMATCWAPLDTRVWDLCHDYTGIWFESHFAEKPIWLEGDVSDQQLGEVFAYIEALQMLSPVEDRSVSVEEILRVWRKPDDPRVVILFATSFEGYSYTLRFKQLEPSQSDSPWELQIMSPCVTQHYRELRAELENKGAESADKP